MNGAQNGVRVELKVELCGDSRLKLQLFDELRVDLGDTSDQRTRHLFTPRACATYSCTHAH